MEKETKGNAPVEWIVKTNKVVRNLQATGYFEKTLKDGTRYTAYPYHPELSELIAACGEDFAGLYKTPKTLNNMGLCIFIAKPANQKNYRKHIGSTPEEAVAGLWIEINDRPQK